MSRLLSLKNSCELGLWIYSLEVIFDSEFKKELRSLDRELQLHILELPDDLVVERPTSVCMEGGGHFSYF